MSADGGSPQQRSTRFAERMNQLMQAQGHTYRGLASAVNADPGYLNHLAKGRRAPSKTMVRLIDNALGANGELVELARHENAPPASSPLRKLGEQEASDTRATLLHLVALDTLNGSDGLVPVATRAFRTIADRLARVGGTPDVRSAVADLGAAAAWIASDATERDQSRAIALEALAIAGMAGDTRMHRFLLSHLSMVSEHAGRYADALAYAEQIVAQEPDSPRVKAMVEVRRARALSGLGDHAAALTAWEHADHLLTESPSSDDGLTYWIHDSEMAIHKAVILTRARSKDAVDWAHRGVEWLPAGQGRDQVLFRAMLLQDAVAAHAWAEIPAVVEDLLRYTGPAPSERIPEALESAWREIQTQRAPATARDAVRAARDAFTEHDRSTARN
jgi:tetratricopeptide (TPR) repeat protein